MQDNTTMQSEGYFKARVETIGASPLVRVLACYPFLICGFLVLGLLAPHVFSEASTVSIPQTCEGWDCAPTYESRLLTITPWHQVNGVASPMDAPGHPTRPAPPARLSPYQTAL